MRILWFALFLFSIFVLLTTGWTSIFDLAPLHAVVYLLARDRVADEYMIHGARAVYGMGQAVMHSNWLTAISSAASDPVSGHFFCSSIRVGTLAIAAPAAICGVPGMATVVAIATAGPFAVAVVAGPRTPLPLEKSLTSGEIVWIYGLRHAAGWI
jgi:hypothetical protein